MNYLKKTLVKSAIKGAKDTYDERPGNVKDAGISFISNTGDRFFDSVDKDIDRAGEKLINFGKKIDRFFGW